MLVGMNKVVETGDHNPDNHKGKALEVFVKRPAALGVSSVQASAGGAKRKNINSYGPRTKHRLGAPKSHVSGGGNKKRPPKCSFCGGGGGGKYHPSMKVCPLKNSYGQCIDVKKEGVANVADDIETLFNGRHGFVDTVTLGNFSKHKFINEGLPTGTKRVQTRAFFVSENKKYLLCTCFDAGGKSLRVQEGSQLTVYENVFLSSTAVTRNVQKCDFVFYKPFTQADKDSGIPSEKSPPETIMPLEMSPMEDDSDLAAYNELGGETGTY